MSFLSRQIGPKVPIPNSSNYSFLMKFNNSSKVTSGVVVSTLNFLMTLASTTLPLSS